MLLLNIRYNIFMADIDIETTISDVKLFLEKLKSELPEVFTKPVRETENQDNNAVQEQDPAGKVLYLGNLCDVELTVNPQQKQPTVFLADNKFYITLTSMEQDPSALCEDFLRRQALDFLTARAKELAAKMEVTFNNLSVKDQKSLWGSCSQKNNLNFSYRLIKMPRAVIDYLIVHELAHLVHFDHSPDFWATVEKFVPDYKQHRRWLNNNKYAVMASSNVSLEVLKENKEEKAGE